MPHIPFNGLAVGLSTLAIFILSFVWYVPLFGKAWTREMGFAADHDPRGFALARSLGLTLLGAALTSVVLHNTMAVWLPRTWGLTTAGPTVAEHAGSAAFFTWAGLVVPVLLRSVAWEARSWTLFAINAGFQLVSLAVAAVLIAAL